MSDISFDVSIRGSADRLAAALAGLDGPEVKRAAVKAVRKAAEPAVADAKRAALALPGARPPTSLRPAIAAAIGVSVRTSGVRIQVNTGRLGNRHALPAYIDDGSWRHPVFGNRNNWVTQRGQAGWWERPFERHRDQIGRAVLDDAEKAIRRALEG